MKRNHEGNLESKTFLVEGSKKQGLLCQSYLLFYKMNFFHTGTSSTEFRRIRVRPNLEKLRSRIQIRNRIHITFRTVKYFFYKILPF
jgi:hypothetical protein